MNHLAEEEDTFRWVFFDGFVADLDGVLYAITKSKMPCDVKNNWAEVECRWREILLAQVLDSPCFFDLTGD
jgi:hypothetical protein